MIKFPLEIHTCVTLFTEMGKVSSSDTSSVEQIQFIGSVELLNRKIETGYRCHLNGK